MEEKFEEVSNDEENVCVNGERKKERERERKRERERERERESREKDDIYLGRAELCVLLASPIQLFARAPPASAPEEK